MLSITKKLQAMGNSTFLVLPKVWTDCKGLKPHDLVELILNDDLTIKPIRSEKERSHVK